MKYGVLNPSNGETTIVASKEEALELFWSRLIEFAAPFFHNTVYVSIQENEDGTTTWFNDQNQEIAEILDPKKTYDIFAGYGINLDTKQ